MIVFSQQIITILYIQIICKQDKKIKNRDLECCVELFSVNFFIFDSF